MVIIWTKNMGRIPDFQILFKKENWFELLSICCKVFKWGYCLEANDFPVCYLFSGIVRIPDDITRAASTEENKQMRHILAHVANHRVCQMEKNKNLEEKHFVFNLQGY